MNLRCFAFLTTLLFTFGVLEIPPSALTRKNPKSCCGRVVCLCKHAPGAPCPVKKNKAEVEKPASHMHCRLKAAGPAPKPVVQAAQPGHCHKAPPKFSAPAPGAALMTKAPCASDAPKTVLPEYSRWYELFFVKDFSPLPVSGKISREPSVFHTFPPPGGIDRPPRILFSF